ncbi:ABC transporter permease [Streptacidiphilus melanogenes]|uniref:ABC transporter permease n=1 Tax=Streptacidiphilus melanogenes TaxID=411235 RepID=UPI000AAF980C|nr:ABC transporter permease [Streptacidiphilus melanogenes]
MSSTAPTLPLGGGDSHSAAARPGASAARAFFFILWRDVFVTGRELVPFLAQVVVEPFFMLFVFGKVLTGLGYAGHGFQQVLLPGVVALSAFLVALQNTAFPLIVDFSFTKEIEDRLLSPIPLGLVAVEKLVFGALRGMIAAAVMVPIGFLLLNDVSWPLSSLLPVVGVLVLGSLAGATLGMTIGTAVESRHISIIITVVLTPLMFTGATQFPWFGLASVRPFQVICALNPLTYVSEGMRAALIPRSQLHSIPLWADAVALTAACLLYGLLGIRGFRKRALD